MGEHEIIFASSKLVRKVGAMIYAVREKRRESPLKRPTSDKR